MIERYYFHLRDGDTFMEDTTGILLQGLDEAIRQAQAAINELLIEQNATRATVC